MLICLIKKTRLNFATKNFILKNIEIMTTHNIGYDGVDYEVIGEWDSPEEETGYKGGFSWMQIKINDMDVSQHLKQETIDTLQDMVVEQNY